MEQSKMLEAHDVRVEPSGSMAWVDGWDGTQWVNLALCGSKPKADDTAKRLRDWLRTRGVMK